MAGRAGPNLGGCLKSEARGDIAEIEVRESRAAIIEHSPSDGDGDRCKQAGPSLLGGKLMGVQKNAADVKSRLTTSWPRRSVAPTITLRIPPTVAEDDEYDEPQWNCKRPGLMAWRRKHECESVGEVMDP